MKKVVFTLLFLAGMLNAYSTNVNGGIYGNTTWTLANSPYIVTDTVVVFPGVTLTIQPGVMVKFDDDVCLEIRQGYLIAQGTLANPITFTSNSGSPTIGIWGNIYLNGSHAKISHCNFYYADVAIINLEDSLKNCTFQYNNIGIGSFNVSQRKVVADSCNFSYNNNGINCTGPGCNYYRIDTLFAINSKFCNNGTGICGIDRFGIIKNCIIDSNQNGINQSIGMACYIMIDNCHIGFNTIGISYLMNNLYMVKDSIKNCIIEYNSNTGINMISGCVVYNCQVNNNRIGMTLYPTNHIIKNNIVHNNIGIQISHFANLIDHNIIEVNDTGILINYGPDTIVCNRICNNIYGIFNKTNDPYDIQNNYWCTADSALIETYIYDGYDNINYGLVAFMPVDTMQCYLYSPCSAYFLLYPDSIIPHKYWAVNMAFGTPPLTYVWSWGDGTFDYTPYPAHTYGNSGFYNICLTITDSVGCTSTYCYNSSLWKNTNSIIYINVIPDPNIITGINANNTGNSFHIYPNPANDMITVESAAGIKNKMISVFNLQGQLILHQPMLQTKQEINISNLAKGFYIIKLGNADGIAVKKFIKE